jgi:hypothetical protein
VWTLDIADGELHTVRSDIGVVEFDYGDPGFSWSQGRPDTR